MLFEEDMLPSRCMVYNVKGIQVNKITPKQISLLSRALMLSSFQPVIDAVGQTIDFDVNQLTHGDFFTLLTYHRCTAFKSNLPTLDWTCDHTIWVDGEGNKYTLQDIIRITDTWDNSDKKDGLIDPNELEVTSEQCGHENHNVVEYLDFSMLMLDGKPDHPRLDIPRCNTLADYIERRKEPNIGLLADAAIWIKEGRTFDDKFEILMSEPDNDLLEAACEAQRDIIHGIKRNLKYNCKGCGQLSTMSYAVTAESFF